MWQTYFSNSLHLFQKTCANQFHDSIKSSINVCYSNIDEISKLGKNEYHCQLCTVFTTSVLEWNWVEKLKLDIVKCPWVFLLNCFFVLQYGCLP